MLEHYEMTHIQFNLLFSIVAVPNIILPFFGGILVDKYGLNRVLFYYCLLMFIAQLVVSLGVLQENYNITLFGRFLYGTVTINIDSAVIFFIDQWFKGKELACAIGISISSGRFGTFLAALIYPRVYHSTNELFLPYLLSLGVVFLAFLISIINYFYNERGKVINSSVPLFDRKNFTAVKTFSKYYWMLCIIISVGQMVFYTFMYNSQEILTHKFYLSSELASNFFAIPFIIGVVLIPIFGKATDQMGSRSYFHILSGIFLVIAFWGVNIESNMCIAEKNCFLRAIVPFLIFALFFSLFFALAQPSVPLLVNQNVMGTAIGVQMCILNVGLTLGPFFFGVIVQHTKKDHGYLFGIGVLLIIAVILLIMQIFFHIIDIKWNKGLLEKSTGEIANIQKLEKIDECKYIKNSIIEEQVEEQDKENQLLIQ